METKDTQLIIISGPDHSGKTLQAKLLVNTLGQQGLNCRYVHFPTEITSAGCAANDILDYIESKSPGYIENDVIINLQTQCLADRTEYIDTWLPSEQDGVDVLIFDRFDIDGWVYAKAASLPLEVANSFIIPTNHMFGLMPYDITRVIFTGIICAASEEERQRLTKISCIYEQYAEKNDIPIIKVCKNSSVEPKSVYKIHRNLCKILQCSPASKSVIKQWMANEIQDTSL